VKAKKSLLLSLYFYVLNLMSSVEQKNRDGAWLALRWKIQEEKIKRAFEIFRENEIEPILIKGWAAARFYPLQSERIFADIDLCVDPALFQKAENVSKNIDVKKLNVDLHNGLRHLDTVAWEDLFENSQLFEIGASRIRLLRPEDHLRVLCVHWLTDGGAYKEKLKDIFYAVENRALNFDWERCLETVSKKRRKWIVCTIGLAEKYFGLSLKDTPIEREAEEIPGWLIKCVEKEWRSNVRLKPIHTCFGDRKQLFQQIRKRIPPNPIQATIEMEGSFDNRPRIFYQVGDVFKRATPSFKRVGATLFRRRKNG
jgi:hypothetical protein